MFPQGFKVIHKRGEAARLLFPGSQTIMKKMRRALGCGAEGRERRRRNGMKTKIWWIVGLVLTVAIVGILTSMLSGAASQDAVEIGGTQIPTLHATAGDKTMTGMESSTDETGQSLAYTYSGVTESEIQGYLAKLEESGFTLTEESGGTYRLEGEDGAIGIVIQLEESGAATITYTAAA